MVEHKHTGLLPCPMCGFSAHLRHQLVFRQMNHFGECQDANCLTKGPEHLTEAEAIAAWNRRSTPIASGGGDATDKAHDLIMRAVDLACNHLIFYDQNFDIEARQKFYDLRDDMRQWLVDVADAALSTAGAAEAALPHGSRIQGMVRSLTQWENMAPDAVMAGSPAQIHYALVDAKHDIAALAHALFASPPSDTEEKAP